MIDSAIHVERRVAPEVRSIGNLSLPEPNTEELSNGSKLFWLDGGTQDVNQLTITWPGGSREMLSQSIAPLGASLLMEGCKGMTGAEISEALDYRGAMLKCEASEHFTIVSLSSLNNMSKGALGILHDIISDPTFPEQPLQVYRTKAAMMLRQQQAKVAYLSQVTLAPLIMGKDNPNAIPDTVESIESVTRTDLERYHSQVFTANGCRAFLSGRISDQVLSDVRHILESLPHVEAPVNIGLYPYHAQAPQTVKVEKADALQSSVRAALPAPLRSHPDYIALRFAVIALGGYFGSRLMRNIREDKGYTYGIQSYLLGSLDGSYTSIAAQADSKYVEPLIAELRKELAALASSPMYAEEMQRLRQHISTSLIETLDSPFAIMDYYRTKELVGLPDDYFGKQVRLLHELTPDTIMEMAGKYLDPDHLRISIAGL